MRLRLVIGTAFWLTIAVVAQAEVWRTMSGEQFEARLSGVYGPLAILSQSNGTRQIAVEALDDAGVERVADFLAAKLPRPPWRTSESAVAKALRNRLQILEQGRLIPFEPGERPEPELYLVYFGAGWNEASRAFVPGLSARYRELKEVAGARVEFVFVSRDRDSSQHTRFVSDTKMPWPVVKYSAVHDIKPIARWDSIGVPSLVVLNHDGEVVLDSQVDGVGYHSPADVLRQFVALWGMMRGESVAAKRAMHRLAVIQNTRAHPQGQLAPRAYVISLDRSRYQSLEVKRFIATLALDERGKVQQASFEPPLPAVLHEQLVRDIGTWLFLPSVKDGRAQPFTVKLPIEF